MEKQSGRGDRVESIEADLRRRLKGEVRFDDGSRALYAADASNYRQPPIGVVIPRDTEDVIETARIACRHGAPLLMRGGGTSLAGQCCNTAILLDTSKYFNRILEIDPDKHTAHVEPGVVLDNLREAAEKHHLTFGPDPSTHNHCTLGGMIGNNSCGVHSVYAGETSDNVQELEVLTYRGERMTVGPTGEDELQQIISQGGARAEIYSKLKALRDRYAGQIRSRFPNIPRRVSGYNLPALLPENGFNVARALTGSECTCVVILSAKVRLVYSPPVRSLLVLGFPDIATAGDHIMEVLDAKPVGLEGIDDRLIHYMERKGLHVRNLDLLPPGGGWLLVEFGGESKQESDDKARQLMDSLKSKENTPSSRLYDDKSKEELIWQIRESGLGATAFVPGLPMTWEGWEDSSVPPQKIGGYLRDFRKLLDKHHYGCALYGHFGQGCLHTRIDFDLLTEEGIHKFRSFLGEAADLVIRYGGSLSGEHGDGQSRAELLPKMFGPQLIEAFREFKSIWDPDWKMNPGKIVDPYLITDNLRLGTGYNPAPVKTHFQYPEENGFANATLRCVGVGECRKTNSGVMCPSYMVTREEMHSTRGRAHLLFEMMQRNVIKDGWRDHSVREALDLCLACKGCKGECPVQVDMATYKAEFLSHYYQGRLRPMAAYSMGLIYWWARLASAAPSIVNYFTQHGPWNRIASRMGGIAPERRIPKFAKETFRHWFKKRKAPGARGKKIILWADTFNNFFHPDTARAAVAVLEDAGFQITLTPRILCCGRPLYDFGMLNAAKKLLRQTLEVLANDIKNGTPIVGLEPSCITVFRDELTNLFPLDQNAVRLSKQSFILSEFLKKEGYRVPQLRRKAIMQAHCHHKSVIGVGPEKEILDGMGMDCEMLDSGCCGMAGSFGFEKEKYDVSVKAGERILLPAVRKASPETIILADGFSCREQIMQLTDRKPMHLAELLQLAIYNRDTERIPAEEAPTAEKEEKLQTSAAKR